MISATRAKTICEDRKADLIKKGNKKILKDIEINIYKAIEGGYDSIFFDFCPYASNSYDPDHVESVVKKSGYTIRRIAKGSSQFEISWRDNENQKWFCK